jgi:hypothetical protein
MTLLARLAPRTCSPSDRASFFFFLPAAPRTKSLRPGFCQGSRDRRIRPVKVELGQKGRTRDEHSWRTDRHKSQITCRCENDERPTRSGSNPSVPNRRLETALSDPTRAFFLLWRLMPEGLRLRIYPTSQNSPELLPEILK